MKAIFWKEFKGYFNSPIAYVLIGLLTIVSSFFFYVINLTSGYGDTNWIFSFELYLFVISIFVSVITMKTLSEERKSGTEVMLITSPQSITSIVVGKYLGALGIFLVMVIMTLVYPIVTIAFGASSSAITISGYIGFILLGSTFVSIGIFASSLTENQIISVIISFASMFIMWLMGVLAPSIGGNLSKILSSISLTSRYNDFSRGIISLGSVVYYLSFIAVFLFLTVRVIEKRRWSQG
jgi:ABC-2 type transport system permease protein